MNNIFIGKLRGIQQLANSKGILTICAADHRESLKKALNPQNPDAVSYQEMVDFKLELCRSVSPFVSAILLDPLYGACQAINSGALPGNVGLLVSMEKSGYTGDSSHRLTEFLPDWNVKKLRKMGASAAKLLVYFRPDVPDLARKQLDLIKILADQCIENDIPLLVEPVSYPVEEEKTNPAKFAEIKPKLVIETARQITATPIDILKAEFPADLNYEKDEGKMLDLCQQLNDASRLPWVILSAGVSYELFKKQVEIASKAGASGFLAGRALWQEAPKFAAKKDRIHFMETTTAERIEELSSIANSLGTPWYKKMPADKSIVPGITEDWYTRY